MFTYPDISDSDGVSRVCFYIGLGFAGVMVIAGFVMAALGFTLADVIPPCIFHEVTGYYCPGCGGTRSVLALFHGRLLLSFLYHPGVLYFAIYYALYESTYLLNIFIRRRVYGFRVCPLVLYIGALLIVVQWLVKNILVFLYGYNLNIWDYFWF